jgi:hypothetical protein
MTTKKYSKKQVDKGYRQLCIGTKAMLAKCAQAEISPEMRERIISNELFFLRGRANAAIQRANKKWRRPHHLLVKIVENYSAPDVIAEEIAKMSDTEIARFERETGVSLYIFMI